MADHEGTSDSEAEAGGQQQGQPPPKLDQLPQTDQQALQTEYERYLRLLEPILVSEFVSWLQAKQIVVENKILGQGNYGVALLASRKSRARTFETGRHKRDEYGIRIREPIVVKWTSLTGNTPDWIETTATEMVFAAIIMHPNIVETYFRKGPVIPDGGLDPVDRPGQPCGFDLQMRPTGGLYMFQEFITGGTLNDFMIDIRLKLPETDARGRNISVPLSPAQIQGWAADILDGLSFLHSNAIGHHDLHLNNTMIDGDGTIKIIDLGCAKQYVDERVPINEDEHGNQYVGLGMPGHVAHGHRKGAYNQDAFRVSGTIFQLADIVAPPERKKIRELTNPSDMEAFLQAVDRWGRNPDPNRFDAYELVQHPWLNDQDLLAKYHFTSTYYRENP